MSCLLLFLFQGWERIYFLINFVLSQANPISSYDWQLVWRCSPGALLFSALG